MTHAHDRKHVIGSCLAGLVVAATIATIGVVTRPEEARADVVTRAAEDAVGAGPSRGVRRTKVPAEPATAKVAPPKPAAVKTPTLGQGVSYAAMIGRVFGARAPEAIRVAICESSLNPGAIGPGGRGLFQINPRHHMWRVQAVRGTTLFDPMTNIRVAKHLFDEQGWRPWACAHAAR